MTDENIVAISTTVGDGAISIVRVSGSTAISEVNKIFSKNILNVTSHTIHYGYIKDNDEIIDEVLLAVMKSPKTFTVEDVVEIYCHGGYAVTNKVLEVVLKQEIRIAHPGEFTKRAFLNGRIDLVQAESISDLVRSKTELSRKVALNSLRKSLSNEVNSIRNEVLNIIANVEVNIDYPEYDDAEEMTSKLIVEKIKVVEERIVKLLNSAHNGQIIENGLVMSIIGSPNVGKSSLLNKLLNKDRAIVTEVAGTTRDTIEEQLIIGGVLFTIIDSAGIRKTEDIVEQIGVKKSLELLNKSDVILFVLNANNKLTVDEEILLKSIGDLNHIVVINKSDLPINLNSDLSEFNTIYTSMLDDNIEELENKIIEVLMLNKLNYEDQTMITKVRHIEHLNNCLASINEIYFGYENGVEIDMLSIDLNQVYFELGSIIGLEASDDILERLFSDFCLGK